MLIVFQGTPVASPLKAMFYEKPIYKSVLFYLWIFEIFPSSFCSGFTMLPFTYGL